MRYPYHSPSSLLEKTPFGKLQALPTDGVPITSSKWPNQDESLFDAAEGIRISLEKIVAQDDANQRILKGNDFYDQKEYERAILSYLEAIRLDPQCFKAHYNIGLAFNELNKYEKAIEAFDEILRNKPHDSQASIAISFPLVSLGRQNDALKLIRRSLSVHPDNEDLIKRLTMLKDINEINNIQPLLVQT